MTQHEDRIRQEFSRAAPYFAERTRSRFDDLDAVAFSKLPPGGSIAEVGAGTGNFLRHFIAHAGTIVALDLTEAMLAEARRNLPSVLCVAGEGGRLPFRSRSLDTLASVQMLHHVYEPVPLLREMARVTRSHVLVVDQLGPENYERLAAMNELERLRDPSHAVSRPRSAFMVMCRAAGLEPVDERIHESRSSLSDWMWPGEFPERRIAAVRSFIEERGADTGMDFETNGADWVFTRRRIMLLLESQQTDPFGRNQA